jgi:hypothetical protein
VHASNKFQKQLDLDRYELVNHVKQSNRTTSSMEASLIIIAIKPSKDRTMKAGQRNDSQPVVSSADFLAGCADESAEKRNPTGMLQHN